MTNGICYCPGCGESSTWEIKDNPKMIGCRCGTVFRIVTSDIHIPVEQNKLDIISVLNANLEIFTVKDELVNEQRRQTKQRAVEYLSTELMKGPLQGGTMAPPSAICDMFGMDVWKALQKAVLIRDKTCMLCHQRPSAEVHHIRPRHLKGKNHPRNLIGLCLECHDEVHRRIDEGIQQICEDSLNIEPTIDKAQRTLDLGVEE